MNITTEFIGLIVATIITFPHLHTIFITTLEEGGGYGPGQKELVPTKYNVASTLTVEVKPGNQVIDFLDLDSEGDIEQGRGERY